MPLPTTGETAWPPAAWKNAYTAYAEWDAWYTGDPDMLGLLYSTTRLNQRSSAWGQVQRMFWGTPTPTTTSQRPNKLHVPLPAEIARMSAALLFSDMPTFTVGDGDGDADDEGLTSMAGKNAEARLAEIVDDLVHATLLEGAELQSGIGGTFLRVTWDKTVDPDKPFLTSVAADAAVPAFRWGRLSSVTFWQELAPLDGQEGTWRLLELHEPGRIEWGLFHAHQRGVLGVRMPLGDHPDAAALASVVDSESGVVTGSKLLTAVYVPNQMPNRKWRKDSSCRNLGRSDFDGVEPVFDALDETYTSWMRDLRLGKARVLVDKQLLDARGPGQGAVFDADREVFVNFDGQALGALKDQGKQIDQIQFAIRVAEHRDTAQDLLERALSGAGYSMSTFGETGDVAMTATEAVQREKLTMLTRGAKLLRWRPALSHIVAALLDVDQHVFGGPGRGDARPDVEFPDAAGESPKVLAETLKLLADAEAASLQTRVEMLHPDWDADQVEQEVQRIRDDAGRNVPDPFALPGAPAGFAPQGQAPADDQGDEPVDDNAAEDVPAAE